MYSFYLTHRTMNPPQGSMLCISSVALVFLGPLTLQGPLPGGLLGTKVGALSLRIGTVTANRVAAIKPISTIQT